MNTLAVSNIAWSGEEDAAAYKLLSEKGVRYLEIAPPRFFPDIFQVIEADLQKVLDPLRDNGLHIPALQAILFGKSDLLLFQENTRPKLAFYLCKMAELCSRLGAEVMVFGAPANRRVPEGMSAVEAKSIAVKFFQEVGHYAEDLGVIFGIEANPAAYQCNFCTHAAEVIDLVQEVNTPGVRWHLDAGELAMNHANIDQEISSAHDLICHAHLSEAMLAGFSNPWPRHQEMIQALEQAKYSGRVSIEMKRQSGGLTDVAVAIDFAHSLGLK